MPEIDLTLAGYGLEPTDRDSRRAQLYRVAHELRALTDQLARTAASSDALGVAADALSSVVVALRAHGTETRTWGSVSDSSEVLSSDGTIVEHFGHFDSSPMVGLGSGIAPPLRLVVDGDVVRGDVVFGPAFEGPPGHVHGGWIAAAFDEVLGIAQTLSGSAGMTVSLRVDYRRAAPLGVPVRYEGRLVRVDGRKILTAGCAFHGETGALLQEAEALFIVVDFAAIAARNTRDSVAGGAMGSAIGGAST